MIPPELNKATYSNYRRRVLWRLQGPKKYQWAFREDDGNGRVSFYVQKTLESWLDEFKNDSAHLYTILKATTEYIILLISDITIKTK